MATNNQISGAPYPMKIGGVSYRARTLSDKDYDELNSWTRWKFIEEAMEAIDKMPLVKERRQEMVTATMLAAAVVTFNSAEGSRIINRSTEGFARLGWQMIHHYHSKVTFEEFLSQVKGDKDQNEDQNEDHTIECMGSINNAFIALNLSGSDEEGDIDENDKTKEPDEDEAASNRDSAKK